MRLSRSLPIFVAMLWVAGAAVAEPAFDAAARAKAVESYVAADTLVVAHIDMARVDPAATEKWLANALTAAISDKETLDGVLKGLGEGMKQSSDFLAQYKKAGGGEMYWVMSATDLESPPLGVILLAPGADTAALGKLLAPPPPTDLPAGAAAEIPVSEKVGDVLLVGPRAKLDEAKKNNPVARPELVKAFTTAGDTTAQILLLPTDNARKMLEGALPQLPPQVGGGATTVVTQGIAWGALSVKQPPEPQLSLLIQSPSADAAKALNDLVVNGLKGLANDPDVVKHLPGIPEIVTLLTPTLAGDRQTISLDDRKATQLIKLLAPALVGAHQTATAVKSMSNERQLLVGGIMYANEHKGEWPPDLATLISSESVPADAQTNPFAKPGEAGYVYIKPAKSAGADVIVIYETKSATPDKVNVGFADGHVEQIPRETLDQKIKGEK